MRLITICCALSLTLSACSVADLSGCPKKDLGLVGQEDGLAGREASLPTQTCQLDESELRPYHEGRKDGLRRYCSAQRGYQLGLEGLPKRMELCADEAAMELQRGFNVGDNLRKYLAERDELLSQAQDTERLAADVTEDSAERQTLLQQAADARFQARQRDNDIEALRGVVAVEKWR